MSSSWNSGWMATVVQGVPDLARLARYMPPTMHVESVASLYPGFIRSLGVCGMIWDIDGTLMRRHGDRVAPHLADAFERLRTEAGLRHVILSNCSEQRFEELSRVFPTIPVLRVYAGNNGLVIRRRLGDNERWTSGGSHAHRDHAARPLRKPSVAMVQVALDELRCTSPATALMVGDQYLTDVAPANMLGVRTVKVTTLEPGSFPVPVRALQSAERMLYRLASWKLRRE